MRNLMAITLTSATRKQIKTISKSVIPSFGRVNIKNSEVVLRKHIFSRRHKIELKAFLLEVLPKHISEWAKSKDIESPLPYFGNTVEFLLHLDSIDERDIVAYLWKCYTRIKTTGHLEDSSVVQERQHKVIVNTYITTDGVLRKIVNDLNRMISNAERITSKLPDAHAVLDVIYKSPDIRGSPRYSYLVEQRLIS
jgi:hypothetical protein